MTLPLRPPPRPFSRSSANYSEDIRGCRLAKRISYDVLKGVLILWRGVAVLSTSQFPSGITPSCGMSLHSSARLATTDLSDTIERKNGKSVQVRCVPRRVLVIVLYRDLPPGPPFTTRVAAIPNQS